MRLYINTQDSGKIEVGLKKGEVMVDSQVNENQFGSQALLPLIVKMLEQYKLSWSDLEAVEVENGPGSFTGIRVGVSVANAIGMGANILVNGKPYETEITYE